MGSTALMVVALAIIASAGTGGALVASNAANSQATDALTDVSELEVCIEVLDAVTNEPLAGAYVEITDGNGVAIASGLTNEDGEIEVSFYTGSTADVDDETDDDCNDLNETEDDCADDVANEIEEQEVDDCADDVNEIDDCTDDDANATDEEDNDDTNEVPDEDDLEASTSSVDDSDDGIYLDSIVGPITVTVSLDGYVTQTMTFDPAVTDDVDETVFLEPATQG